MPKCGNCDKKYYKGSEKSPTGKGLCGMCENVNFTSMGTDKREWVVAKRKTGRYWKRKSKDKRKSKTKRKSRAKRKSRIRGKRALRLLEKRRPESLEVKLLPKEVLIYTMKYLDEKDILNTCEMNSDYARFCLRNQTEILRSFFNNNTINASDIYPKWKKVEKDMKQLTLEGRYHQLNIIRKGNSKIAVEIKSFRNIRRGKDSQKAEMEYYKLFEMLEKSGLKLKKGIWYLNNVVPRFHFNILIENARKFGLQ